MHWALFKVLRTRGDRDVSRISIPSLQVVYQYDDVKCTLSSYSSRCNHYDAVDKIKICLKKDVTPVLSNQVFHWTHHNKGSCLWCNVKGIRNHSPRAANAIVFELNVQTHVFQKIPFLDTISSVLSIKVMRTRNPSYWLLNRGLRSCAWPSLTHWFYNPQTVIGYRLTGTTILRYDKFYSW